MTHKSKTVAAVAIAAFWCVSAVGTTVGTAVGVTSLATESNAVTSRPADARRYWRRSGGVGVGLGGGVGGVGIGTSTVIT
jgi:hypothetical protein